MSTKLWPIRPDHITDDQKLAGTGVISSFLLQAFQSEICDRIEFHPPTTVIEFDKDGKKHNRTDSPLLKYAMNPACRAFRDLKLTRTPPPLQINGTSSDGEEGVYCRLCDRCFAHVIHGMSQTALNIQDVRRRTSEDGDLASALSEIYGHDYPDRSFLEPVWFGERLVLQYNCPFLGFRELIFPVILENRAIAELIVGQIVCDDQVAFIEQTMTTLPKRHPGLFCSVDADDLEKIAQSIYGKYNDWLNEPMETRVPPGQKRVLTKDEYERLILQTIDAVKNFEAHLTNMVRSNRDVYIHESVRTALDSFLEYSPLSKSAAEVNDSTLAGLWSLVEQVLQRTVEAFSFDYELIFGIDSLNAVKAPHLMVVGKTGQWRSAFSEEQVAKLALSTDKLGDGPYTHCSFKHNIAALQCLGEYEGGSFTPLPRLKIEHLGDFELIVLSVGPSRCTIGFLVGYTPDNPSNAPENTPGGSIKSSLRSLDNLILSSLAAILARSAEDVAKVQLQYLGHEGGQLLAGLDWRWVRYISRPQLLRALTEKQCDTLCKDMESAIGQLSFFFDVARHLGTGLLPHVSKTDFRPFGDVIFKWNAIYRKEAEHKRLQFNVPDVKQDDSRRPEMFGDKFLFEQIVYNLVGNAEKYSYRGTQIHMDCTIHKSQNDNNYYHVLTISNYGPYLNPNDRDIYLPHVRKSDDVTVKGLGMGLYIAHAITTKVFDGEIAHYCADANGDLKPISQYNIPLIRPYLERAFPGKDPHLADILRRELDHLMSSELQGTFAAYDRIVALSKDKRTQLYYPEDGTIAMEINKPTYYVVAIVTIPHEER